MYFGLNKWENNNPTILIYEYSQDFGFAELLRFTYLSFDY